MIAHRKNNPPKAGERIAIDAIIEGHDSEESVLSECMTMMIGGFHTSGLRKLILNPLILTPAKTCLTILMIIYRP